MHDERREFRASERGEGWNEDIKNSTTSRSEEDGQAAAGKEEKRGRRDRTSGVSERMPSAASDKESSSSRARLKSDRQNGR